MKELSTIEHLSPAIDVMGDILTETSSRYQHLLTQPQSHPFCLEAGRSLRCLYDRYSQVLIKAFEYTPDPAAEEVDDETPEDDEGAMSSEDEAEAEATE